jgi:hypothetical protein
VPKRVVCNPLFNPYFRYSVTHSLAEQANIVDYDYQASKGPVVKIYKIYYLTWIQIIQPINWRTNKKF